MKTSVLTLKMLLISTYIYTQCECTDCPIDIEEETTQSSFLDIDGATNDELGVNGQSLCMVCLNLTQDAMEELDINLIAPDGSSVALTVNNLIGAGIEIFFEICFVSCNQSAQPDSGFADVFDTSNPWQDFTTYDGTYYPQEGCLEDLTGDINGEWELEITDVLFAENGELFDWYLVFSDDSGLGCSNTGECSEVICSAEGGELNIAPIDLCEGDTGLNLDIDPTFPNNNEPLIPQFGYSWIIVNTDTDAIEDINMDSDLTAYEPGNYLICGLSFLSDDEPLIPSANGSLTIDDIEDNIDDDVYCADLSDDCIEITINEPVMPPDFDGPIEICIDEVATYTILDFDPSINYIINFTGSTTFFSGNDDTYEISWDAGPAQICVLIESSCGDVETCIDVELLGSTEDLEIIGNLEPCPGSIELYTFEPIPSGSESYVINITGGTIINMIGNNSIEVEWPDIENTGEICIELIGGICPPEELCENVEIELDFELPDELNSPETICEGDIGVSEINSDNNIIEYIWTVTNLDILSGQNSEIIEYSGINPGTATVCLEIITACGIQGPVCETLEVLEIPDPIIDEITPSCNFTFTLVSNADLNNDIQWTLEDPGNVNIENENDPTTEVTVDKPGIYIFHIEEANSSCLGTDQITIEILDDLILSEFTFDCNANNEFTVTFDILNGLSPYFLDGVEISGNTFTSNQIESGEDFEFEITDALGCSAIAEDDFTCPCLSESGNMSTDLIALCIADEIDFEAKYENDGFFDNNDIGAFYIHTNSDDELGDILDFNMDGEFEFDPTLFELGVEYYISFIIGNNDGDDFPDLDDECLSVSIGQPVIFFDLPDVALLFEEETCSDEITITGTLDLETTIDWSQTNGPETSIFSDEESLPVTIMVTEQDEYSFEAKLQNQACVNFIEIDIDFLINPNIINVNEDCNSSADFYTINFEIEGGIAPFTSSIPGSFVQNNFISDPIPTGQNYQVSVIDDNGCQSALITGTKLCDCISTAGFMNNDLVQVCISTDSIAVDSSSNSLLDGDDIGIYFLHTSSTNILGTVISTSNNGVFFYDPTIITDSIYYISFVVGNNINGEIDFSDPCLDIASGQPVIWNSIPIVDAGMDLNTCENQITLNATPANGEWEIISFPNSLNSAPAINNNTNLTVDLPVEGNYIFVRKASNGLCINSDTVSVAKNGIPTITNIRTECAQDLQSFDLSFEIEGSNAPYTINGDPSSSNYSTSNLDASTSFDFIVANTFGCSTIVSIGPISCECESDAGTINNTIQNLCSFDSIDINISNLDFIIEPGDTIAYIVHDGDENNIGNIIGISYGEDIPFNNNFEFNTTYFLTLIVANITSGEIDLDDICLKFSEGVPIIFTEEINVTIGDELEGCIDDIVTFNISSNTYPVEIILESSLGREIEETINNNTDQIEVTIIDIRESWTIQSINNECVNNLSGTITINGQAPNIVDLAQGFEICNNDIFGSTVNIEELFIGTIPTGEWILNGVQLINGELNFNGLLPGTYELTFSNIGFDNLCMGNSDQITFNVIECLCAEFRNQDITICNDSPNIPLSNFDSQNLEGTWEVSSLNNPNNSISIVNDELVFNNPTQGTYSIIYNITEDNYPSECEQNETIFITIESPLSAGEQIEFPIFCNNENVTIDLTDFLEGNDPEGIWSFNGSQLLSAKIELDALELGLNVFTYQTPGGIICQGELSNVLIELEAEPIISVTSQDILCFGADDGEISITIENPNGEIIECYVNDVIQSGGKSITGLSPGTYNIYTMQGQCRSETIQIILTEPEPLTVELGNDREIEIEEELIIEAIVNILESDIAEITWSDLSGVLGITELELIAMFENNNTINIEILDKNGCVAIDALNIRVNAPNTTIEDIYIPNIFAPDGNDENNQFGIQNTAQINLLNKFNIYDRWGNKVFSKENVVINNENLKWDGFFNNKPAIQGVYVYLIEVTFINGDTKIFAGDITLIR